MGGVDNWSNGCLPSLYQGTVIRSQEPRILNLDASAHLHGKPQESSLALSGADESAPSGAAPGKHDLAARIASFQLAARMQLAAEEALDLSQESAATHKMYGLDDPLTRGLRPATA